jgi:hypothetical protein
VVKLRNIIIRKDYHRTSQDMTTNVNVPLPFGEPQGLVEDLVIHPLNVSVVVWRQSGQHLHGEGEREIKRVSVCECERQRERERGGVWQKKGGQDKEY